MKVVLATDGSTHAEHAARCLSRIPHREPIDLTVITTVYIPDASAGAASDAWLPVFKQEQHDTAQEHFANIAKMFSGADVQVRHKICEGHVGHSICDAAEEIGADLIVLGAKGHSTINRILLGSVSDFVATHAKCSVLVVRPPQSDSADKVRVTLAHDGTDDSDVAVKQFARFEWGGLTDGYVLSVVPIIRTFRQDLFPDMTAQRAEQREEATQKVSEAIEQLHDAAPRLQPMVIESEHIGEAIICFAGEQGCNTIVVGQHQRSALGRLMLGSVSRYVLRHAECSVWIAR